MTATKNRFFSTFEPTTTSSTLPFQLLIHELLARIKVPVSIEASSQPSSTCCCTSYAISNGGAVFEDGAGGKRSPLMRCT